MRSFIGFLLLIFTGFTVCEGQKRVLPKTAVDGFLHKWLIDQNMASVEKAFDAKAFASRFMFSEMCAGTSEQERKHPDRLKRKVLEFLGEVSKESVGKTLGEKLEFDWEKKGNMGALIDKSISSVKQDRYVLVNAKLLAAKQQYSYLRKRYPSNSYLGLLIVVRIKDSGEAALIFTWAKRNSVWKIVDFQMECQ